MHAALYEGRKYRGGKEGGYLGIESDGHILTVAPTRSGKGVGLVIPNLLNYGQSPARRANESPNKGKCNAFPGAWQPHGGEGTRRPTQRTCERMNFPLYEPKTGRFRDGRFRD